jgi:transcriptional antiterminator RfaH
MGRETWYVVACEPHRDRQVERVLGVQVLEVFAPRLPRTRTRNGDKPLFPGYLFVRIDCDEGGWARLRYVPGVRNLVTMGGEPCPVDGSLVEAIRRRVAVLVPPDRKPLPGDRVRIRAGSFADIEGLLCESLNGEERVAVLIGMMRSHVRVELPIDDLEIVADGWVA